MNTTDEYERQFARISSANPVKINRNYNSEKDIIVDVLIVYELKEIMAKNPTAKYKTKLLAQKVYNMSDDTLIIAKNTITSHITYIDVQDAENILGSD